MVKKAAMVKRPDDLLRTNANDLEADLRWLGQVIEVRLNLYFGQDTTYSSVFDLQPPAPAEESSLYASFVNHYQLDFAARITLLLALAPHLHPQLLDIFFTPNQNLHRGFTEFGGIKGHQHSGFLPTAETVLFVLAGDDLSQRLAFDYLFDRDYFLARHGILRLEAPASQEPRNSGALLLSPEVIDLITTGKIRKPGFSRDFPAKLLTTSMNWSDLVLGIQTVEQLEELSAWMHHEKTLMEEWEMARTLKPGYKCLFYGPPGTGKTLTATLLGKRFQKDVYRIDLSTVVSKYIGETEKNLENIFERTSFMDCILFFDEADALFGKRTSVNEAHDRYANQEVSYLLQRIEDYEGLVILASNFKSNIDEAFLRRFQSIVHFPMPDVSERHQLWEKAFSSKSRFEAGVNLKEIAKNYKLSGGSIINVVRYASLMTIQRASETIRLTDITAGIRREFQKEGKNI